jgi:energy-coupling factor transporter ATP-binding protein EcfA2
MRISSVEVHGLKGLQGSVELERPCVLLTGPVGAGKSTLIEALRLVVGLPTQYGSNMGQHSPTGQWGVALTTEHGRPDDVHTFGRFYGAKTTLRFDGQTVNSETYNQRLAGMGFETTTPDLSEFIKLSPQQRSAYFAKLLGGESFTMRDAVKAATGVSVADFARTVVGSDAGLCSVDKDEAFDFRGTPGEICDAMNVAKNLSARKHRDAETHYEQLHATPLPQAEDLKVLKDRLEANAARFGEVKQGIENAEQETERSRAAARMLEEVDRDLAADVERKAKLTQRLEALDNQLVDLRAQHKAAVEADNEARRAHSENSQVWFKEVDRLNELRLQGVANPAVAMLAETYDAVPATMIAQVCRDAGVDLTQDQVNQLAFCAFNSLIRPWLEAQHARFTTRAQEHQAAVDDQTAVVDRHRDADMDLGKKSAGTGHRVQQLTNAIGQAEASMRSIQEQIDGIGPAVVKKQERRASLATSAGKTSVALDLEVAKAELETLAATSKEIREKIKEAERVQSVSGQRERARAEKLAREVETKVCKALVERLQAWRDGILSKGMNAVLTPLRGYLGAVFNREVNVKIRQEGSGRASTFTFTINDDRGFDAPLETLSRGQATLVGAAFLRAMFDITGAADRFKVLTLEAADLDRETLQVILCRLPGMKFDFVMLENNRTQDVVVPEGWQVVNASEVFRPQSGRRVVAAQPDAVEV